LPALTQFSKRNLWGKRHYQFHWVY